jgi:ribonucleoside-diphosphate reductase alpha chain
MGFADLLIAMGIPYDSFDAAALAEAVMHVVNEAAVEASETLAAERGAFPNFDSSVYAARGLPPRRNATVTTVAPTGSISIIAGASGGVEPVFALAFKRNVLDGAEMTEIHPLFEAVARQEGFYSEVLIEQVAREGRVGDVEDVPERWRAVFQTAHEVSPEGHVRIQAAFQRHTENAVSKTVNLAHDATADDVERVFRVAFDAGCKGVTVYRDGSRDAQVLSAGTATANVPSTRRGPSPRPEMLTGQTVRMMTGCGNLYVTTNEGAAGPFELFAHIGKTGGCAASQTEAIGRLVSLALRSGVDPAAVAKQLRGVRCPFPSSNRGHRVLSCADAIGQVLDGLRATSETPEALATGGRAERLAGTCIDCGHVLEFEGGCVVCRACGFTRC